MKSTEPAKLKELKGIDLSTPQEFRRRASLLLIILPVLLITPAIAAAQSHCGRAGQRPCRVWERVPSCNEGLKEDFAIDKCIKPTACGGLNQRACRVTERIPSCNPGLAEYRGRCVSLNPDLATTLRFCNTSGSQTVYAAYAYWAGDNGWQTVGWFTLEQSKCENVTLPKQYKGDVYTYATDENTLFWTGKDATLCVNWEEQFSLARSDERACTRPPLRKVGMTRLAVKPGINTRNFGN